MPWRSLEGGVLRLAAIADRLALSSSSRRRRRRFAKLSELLWDLVDVIEEMEEEDTLIQAGLRPPRPKGREIRL